MSTGRNTNVPHLRGANQRANLQRSVAAQEAMERPLRRFRPRAGTYLPLTVIRGPWQPSGALGGHGIFIVRWATRAMDFWAALADFAPADRDILIEQCMHLDRAANGPQCDGGGY